MIIDEVNKIILMETKCESKYTYHWATYSIVYPSVNCKYFSPVNIKIDDY